jgi:hypothetical protein
MRGFTVLFFQLFFVSNLLLTARKSAAVAQMPPVNQQAVGVIAGG